MSNLNVVQFIVESSTNLLNTVGCYGYRQIYFFIFLFSPFFFVSLNSVYFDLKFDAACNGVKVGCLGVSVIDVP